MTDAARALRCAAFLSVSPQRRAAGSGQAPPRRAPALPQPPAPRQDFSHLRNAVPYLTPAVAEPRYAPRAFAAAVCRAGNRANGVRHTFDATRPAQPIWQRATADDILRAARRAGVA